MATDMEKRGEQSPEAAEITKQILADISRAGEDKLFSPSDLISADALLNVPLSIKGYRTQMGDFGEYAVIQATRLDTREEVDPGISCGSVFVLAQLHRAKQLNIFPITVRFEERQTGGGFRVLRLVSTDRPSVAAKGGKK